MTCMNNSLLCIDKAGNKERNENSPVLPMNIIHYDQHRLLLFNTQSVENKGIKST